MANYHITLYFLENLYNYHNIIYEYLLDRTFVEKKEAIKIYKDNASIIVSLHKSSLYPFKLYGDRPR